MKLRLSLAEEISGFNQQNDFLQSEIWASLKEEFGWQPLFFHLEKEGESLNLLVLKRNLKGPYSFAYIPHAPSSDSGFTDLDKISGLIKLFLGKNCLFLRFDLPEPAEKYNREGLLKANADVQPPDTVRLNLEPSEEKLLAAMHKKWRYNIRLADKKKVEVIEASPDKLKNWYSLYQETAARDKISIHPFSYYETLFRIVNQSKQEKIKIKLLMAKHEEDWLAGIIVLLHPQCSVYLYGASSSRKRNLMPNYALQWLGIRLAKQHGSAYYDFFGIPPSDDPAHPMYGLYKFKTGFGGEILHFAGCWDKAYKPLLYFCFQQVEKLRYWYYKVFRKRF